MRKLVVGAALAVAIVVPLAVVPVRVARADGSFSDADDVTGAVDLKQLSFSVGPDSVTYTAETFEPFATEGWLYSAWRLDTNADGSLDTTVNVDASISGSAAYIGMPNERFEVARPTPTSMAFTIPRSRLPGPVYDRYVVMTTWDFARSPTLPVKVWRLGGGDRIDTVVAVSRATPYQVGQVVLARYDQFADALAGGALGGPLLVTPRDHLDTRVRAELVRVLRPGGRVVLLGGELALTRQVEADVASLGFQTVRYAGADRYDTSVKIAEGIAQLTGQRPIAVFLATGDDFRDPLVAAGAASSVMNLVMGTRGGAVLLTRGAKAVPVVSNYLAAHADVKVTAVGAAAAAAYPTARAIVGVDPFDTARRVAEDVFRPPGMLPPPSVKIATALSFPDALAAATAGGPLLLTLPDRVPAALAEHLRFASYQDVYLYGDTAAISTAVENQIASLAQ